MVEEFCFGPLHSFCGIGVAGGLGNSFECLRTESGAQELVGFFQGQQGLERSLVAPVAGAFSALLVDFDFRLGAWAVVVEIGVEVVAVEAVDLAGVGLVDVSVADVFADDPAVLGLDQAVVSGVAGPAFGPLDA